MQPTNQEKGLPAKSLTEAGQTIVEATIALASILLTLAAISIAISTSVSNSTFVKQQTQASKYAQDGMEQLRYLRNSNPTTFFSKAGTKCFNEGDINNPSTLVDIPCLTVNIASTFKREAEFSDSSTECQSNKKVVVNVYWSSGKCSLADTFCHKSQLVSCFINQTGTSNQL